MTKLAEMFKDYKELAMKSLNVEKGAVELAPARSLPLSSPSCRAHENLW